MATLDDAAVVALGMPDVTEGERRGNRTWHVAGKGFAWAVSYTHLDVYKRQT